MSSRLYSPKKGDKISITKEDQEMIASLTSEVRPSGYYDYMVVWSTEDEEFLSNQDNYLDKMQMISMTATPKLDKDKYKFYDVHYKLLRLLYIDEYFSDGCICMGYKKPFGNSNVYGDVWYCLYELGLIKKDSIDGSKIVNDVLKEFSTFIVDFFKGGYELLISHFDAIPGNIYLDIDYEIYRKVGLNDDNLHTYLSYWKPSISEMRNRKLNELGIN